MDTTRTFMQLSLLPPSVMLFNMHTVLLSTSFTLVRLATTVTYVYTSSTTKQLSLPTITRILLDTLTRYTSPLVGMEWFTTLYVNTHTVRTSELSRLAGISK